MSETLCNVCRVPVRGATEFLCPKHGNAVSPLALERWRKACAAVMRERQRLKSMDIYPPRVSDATAEQLALAYRICREEMEK